MKRSLIALIALTQVLGFATDSADWNPAAQWIGYSEPLPGVRSGPSERELSLEKAQWIWAVGQPGDIPERKQPGQRTGTRYAFRQTFECAPGKLEWAVLRLSIDGSDTVVRVNGQWVDLIANGASGVSNAWLMPVDLDISACVKPGANTVEISIHQSREEGIFGFQGTLCWKVAAREPQRVATGKDWQAVHVGSAQMRPLKLIGGWNVPRRSARIRTDRWGQQRTIPLLRREFTVARGIRSAVVAVCGLGFYELRLNGAKVGDRVLDPAAVNYNRRVLFTTYDVSGALRPGANVLGLMLGNGWYNQANYELLDFDIASWRDEPKARLQLRLEYEDGRVEWLVSDSQWKAARSPVVCDGIRNGELYDARLEQPGWDTPGFAAGGWQPAIEVAAPKGRLTEMKMPPERVMEILTAAEITETDRHSFLLKFPRNISGWPRLRVSGPRGTRVTLYCSEVRDDRHDGHVVREGPFQTDTYILKGEGVEIYEPRFTYHGFQYVEVTGFPGELGRDNVTAAVVHTDFESAGTFSCSSPLLNAIQVMTRHSFLGNYHGFPTDCPTREKAGWTADAHLAAETGLLNFHAHSAYSKWLDDILDCQHADGRVPDIVPTDVWGYNGHFDWDCVIVYLPWYTYLYTGDAEPLSRAYEGMKRFFGFYFAKAQNGILDNGRGDWCPVTTVTPRAVTSTAMLADCARILARIAGLLEKSTEQADFQRKADDVTAAFVRRFVQEDGTVANGSQTAQSCALFFRLVPESKRAAVAAKLAAAVKAADEHLDVGILGSKYLFTSLSENGLHDLACRIASQHTFPGYGWWVEKGYTALPETWSGDTSLNHIMFGDISAWFYRQFAGIKVREDAPGFRRFLLQPRVWEGLDHVAAEHQTSFGRIGSAWKRVGEKIDYRMEVPPGTEATVLLQGRDGPFETTVGPGTHHFTR